MRTLISSIACALLVAIAAPAAGQGQAAPPAVRAGAPAAQVNLNTATAADLDTLPGIGPKVAARIIEFRQKNGGFKKAEDLMSVKGIGEKQFLRLKPLVTVASARPADKSGEKLPDPQTGS